MRDRAEVQNLPAIFRASRAYRWRWFRHPSLHPDVALPPSPESIALIPFNLLKISSVTIVDPERHEEIYREGKDKG